MNPPNQVPAFVVTSAPQPVVVWNQNSSGGRWQLCFPDSNGGLTLPFAELEATGPNFQILRLGYPSGPCAVDGNGKILVSGMVDQ